MATARDICEGALNNLALYQPGDSVPNEVAAAVLARLKDFLNGLNARGAVFETVDLALADPIPVADQNIGDLKWALAKYMQGQFGKALSGTDLAEATSATNRFIAASIVVYPAVTDAGLKRMPSTRRYWTGT